MKSKFTQVAKIRKKISDEVEVNLLEARYKAFSLKSKISLLREEIVSCKFPKQGSFSLVQQVALVQNILQNQKKQLEENLVLQNNKILILQDKHRKARLDYEKMKALEEKDINDYFVKQKRLEQKEIDEIALQKFNFEVSF